MTLAQVVALIDVENTLNAPGPAGSRPPAEPERGSLGDLVKLATLAGGS